MNQIYLVILIVIGGLFIGLGVMKLWTNPTTFPKPKVKGLHRTYYTAGELLKQKLTSLYGSLRKR
jgi:hypothetical protein